MQDANLRELLARPGLKAGHGLFEFDTPGIGQIMAPAGVEYAFVDLEHSGFSIATLKRMITALRAASIPALVRPPSDASHHIARVLDAGADGLLMPMVGSGAQAAAIVQALKYPPQGARGVALGIAHDRYQPGPAAEKMAAANARTALAVLVETRDGIDNIDDIAATDGVDCLWIGHFDLSASMDISGQFEHPDFTAAENAVIAAAKRHGKALGRLVSSADEGAALYARGFDVICYSGDLWVYQQGLIAGMEALRSICAEEEE